MALPIFANVDKTILEKYYELWRTGADDNQMLSQLGITQRKFEEYAPAFLNYVRHRATHETRKSLTENGTPAQIEATLERKAKLLEYLAAGLDIQKATKVMGIPLATLTEQWYKDDAMFKIRCEEAAILSNVEVVMALKKRSTGYKFTQTTITETVSALRNSNGEKITRVNEETGEEEEVQDVITVTSKTNKDVLPETNAIKFYLVNRDPENWTLDGLGNNDANQGMLLKAIRAIVQINPDENLDDKFKEDDNP